MLSDEFMREVFEIAFGTDQHRSDFTREDILQRLRELADTARKATEPAKSDGK